MLTGGLSRHELFPVGERKYMSMKRLAAALGIAGIALACAIAALVYTGISIARNIRVSGSPEGTTKVETPFGELRVRSRDRMDLKGFGIPVYPGARRLDDSRKVANIELDFGNTFKDLTVTAAEFETDDPVSDVERYYRDRLPGASFKGQRNQGGVFHFEDAGLKKVVALHCAHGRTRIALASIGEGAAN